MATILGTLGDDTLHGTGAADVMRLYGGNDTAWVLGGSDRVSGAAGNDRLFGGQGDDRLDGGIDRDRLFGGTGNDTLLGGDGADGLWGNSGHDRLDGGTGNDALAGGAGRDTLLGGAGNDSLDGGDEGDMVLGGAGDDRLFGGSDGGADWLDGGGGNDTLDGGAGGDSLLGGTGRGFDRLAGGSGNDRVDGGAGEDSLNGDAGADVLVGGGGWDRLGGGAGNDSLTGGDGYDRAVLAGREADFAVNRGADGSVTVVDRNLADGNEGRDRLSTIEALVFTDGEVPLTGRAVVIDPPASLDALGRQGFTIFGGEGGVGVGDVNGDGLADLLVGDTVVFGRSGGERPDVDLDILAPGAGFRLLSSDPYWLREAAAAGDVNGDHIGDLIVGEPRSTGPGGDRSGEAFVVFGRTNSGRPDVNLGNLQSADGVRILGPVADDSDWTSDASLGASVSSAGDVNGDGLDDLIVGGDGLVVPRIGENFAYSGQGWVLFGDVTCGIDVQNLSKGDGFDLIPTSNYTILANEPNPNTMLVSKAGDVNGDGIGDVVTVDALFAQSYVIFGRPGTSRADVALSDLEVPNGFRGGEAGSASGVGDINGDGFADLALRRAGFRSYYGSSYGPELVHVLYGNAGNSGAAGGFSLLSDRFELEGGSFSSSEVNLVGDVNGDGVDDLVLSSTLFDPYGSVLNAPAPAVYVIFGRAGSGRADIDLDRLSRSDGFRIEGASSIASAGDVNGDGFDDVIVRDDDAAHVIFGSNFSDAVSRLGTSGGETLTGTSGRDDIVASQGDDRVLGLSGADVLKGGAGNDVLMGSTGNDLLEGDSGADRFVLAPGDGHDRVRDFENGIDRIDLRAFEGLRFGDLDISSGVASGGPGTLVAIDATTSLRLLGIPAGCLDAGDLLFG